jgi:hypothetical protein
MLVAVLALLVWSFIAAAQTPAPGSDGTWHVSP